MPLNVSGVTHSARADTQIAHLSKSPWSPFAVTGDLIKGDWDSSMSGQLNLAWHPVLSSLTMAASLWLAEVLGCSEQVFFMLEQILQFWRAGGHVNSRNDKPRPCASAGTNHLVLCQV